MDQAIRKAQGVILAIPHDEEIYRRYQMRELALADYKNSIYSAYKRGFAIGKQKWLLRLSQNGLSATEISELTDLSVEKIEKILKELLINMEMEAERRKEQHERERYCAYLVRELAKSDIDSSVSAAEKREIAISEQEEQQEYVLTLSQNGFFAVEISRITDLSVEEIEKILKEQST
jgi:uncharacterized protein